MPAASTDMANVPHPAPQLEAAEPELTPEQIAAERVRTLISNNLDDRKQLTLSHIDLSEAEAKALADALKTNTSINRIQRNQSTC